MRPFVIMFTTGVILFGSYLLYISTRQTPVDSYARDQTPQELTEPQNRKHEKMESTKDAADALKQLKSNQ